MIDVELIKLFLPFATFALGVLFTPLVETIKERGKWKALRKNLMMELDDELAEVPKRLKKMALTLDGLRGLEEGSVQLGKPIKYIPRRTEIYFLRASTEAFFRSLDKNQRYAVKSLFTQIDALDKYVESMICREVLKETLDECIKDVKRYLYTGSSLLNSMRIVAQHPSANLSYDDDEIVNKALSELNIGLTVDDLVIKGKSISL